MHSIITELQSYIDLRDEVLFVEKYSYVVLTVTRSLRRHHLHLAFITIFIVRRRT
jgi:hypothetical protein